MIKNLLFFFGILLFCSGFAVPQKTQKKADKVIAKFFDIEDFSKEFISVSESDNESTISEFDTDNFFKIFEGDSLLGYGYIGNAPSKTATYDYLVLFDTDFIITKSKVLIYREEYGGEIGSKRWLRQFDGKTPASEELRYNQEIIPISGATISVRSMTLAMNNLLKSLNQLQKRNVL